MQDCPRVGYNVRANRGKENILQQCETSVPRRESRISKRTKAICKTEDKAEGFNLPCSSAPFQFPWDHMEMIYGKFTRWRRFGAEAAAFGRSAERSINRRMREEIKPQRCSRKSTRNAQLGETRDCRRTRKAMVIDPPASRSTPPRCLFPLSSFPSSKLCATEPLWTVLQHLAVQEHVSAQLPRFPFSLDWLHKPGRVPERLHG
jgi:hypothetical protein